MNQVILDTGPLVAAINQQDTYHLWTVEQLKQIRPPLLTCEAVISEACFLLRSHNRGVRPVFEWLNDDCHFIWMKKQKRFNS